MLDPQIRNWVLFPIFSVMLMQGFIRQNIFMILKSSKPFDVEKATKNSLAQRSQRLRANGRFIPKAAYRMRVRFFTEDAFKPPPPPKEGELPEMPQQDPMAMMGTMTQQMGTIVPNMIMMAWVNYFFDGFVLVKLPFGLTDRFKLMLQKGIHLNSLHVSYVSALSWYFINLFGLRGFFSIILGANNAADNAKLMQAQMGGQAGPPGMVDHKKVFATEVRELQIALANCEFEIPDAEDRLEKKSKLLK